MKRLVAAIAASTGLTATLLCAAGASAEDYTFTVPVSVTVPSGSPKPTMSVLCAVAAPGAKLTYDTTSGGIIGGLRNVAGGDGSGTTNVNLQPSGNGFSGSASVRVTATLPTSTGPISPSGQPAGAGKGAPAVPPTYMCAANAGSAAFYTTPPVVSGNLPVH